MLNFAPMKMNGKIWLSLMAGILAISAGWLFWKSQQRQAKRQQVLLESAFGGDAAAFETLRADARDEIVTLMEEFVRHRLAFSMGDVEAAIQRASSRDADVSRPALARLLLLPEATDDWLKSRVATITNEPGRTQLKAFAQNRSKLQKRVAGFLEGLYAEHFNRLFTARRTALMQDCHDLPAGLFFAYAPFDTAWTMLKNSPAEAQLRFLLLRLHSGRDQNTLEHLERFPAQDVLRAAAETWWPVEIEPPANDGAYSWTTRAAHVQSNVANHVLRLSIRPSRKPGVPEEWLHLDRWSRWTYLFQYKEPILNKDAVVYAEGIVRRQNQGWRNSASSPREKDEGNFWLPWSVLAPPPGPGRCETIRGVPAGAHLPVVAISKEEELRWHSGATFEWSRALIPPEIQARLRIEPNRFPPPRVYASAEEASADTGRARTKRKK